MVDAACKLPWDTKNAALFNGDQVFHTDWPGMTISLGEWVGRMFTGHFPSWNSIDGAIQLPWSHKDVALFSGGEVWHSDWPGNTTLSLADWVAKEFTGKSPSWNSIDAACKLPWDTKNAALFNGDQVFHTDWPGMTISIGEWVGRMFTGHFPSWNSIDGALQLPWSHKDVALFSGGRVWHSDWGQTTLSLASWVAQNFSGSLPEGWAALNAAVQEMIVIKKDGGGQTRPMQQAQAQSYLVNVIKDVHQSSKEPSLKQALNQTFDGGGKATGSYIFNGQPVLHASSGNGQTSCTLFFYMAAGCANLFAMGEHKSGPGTRYEITTYGQAGTDFAYGKTISI